ncbi:nucleolar and coiled-body phosphoprotein 1 isoform X2 [Chaetodon trifascialis]|uniref:nucleolar and coiled-body phosphoprotein 1 isoform X2 n=1 Tax=Chaetodon trifascialis TaxID=109706 RepID=UPI00399483A8
METKYPTLRRPKRKLCYFTNKESSSKQWTRPLALTDIDKIFDDLDSSSQADDDDLLHPSTGTNESEREAPPVPQKEHLTEKLPRCQTAPEKDILHPATRSPSTNLDLDSPFKDHGPVKTSSPIEKSMVVEGVEELDNEKDRVVAPILFACEDAGEEEANTKPPPAQKPQDSQHVTEEIDDSDLEAPPGRISLSKPKMSSHTNKVEGSGKDSHPVKEKTPKKHQPADLEGKRKAPRQENTDPSVSAVRQGPEVAASKKKSDSADRQPSVEASTRVGKDMTTFLQKLREAGRPKPACSRDFLPVVKVPTAPEPEDDFLILEDVTPIWFPILSKTANSKRQRQSKTSSTNKDNSTDKGAQDSPPETAQTQQESEQANGKLGSQTVSQKMKKMKEKEKKNEATEPGNHMDELCSLEDAGDLTEQEKPNKKKQRLKKVPSKESDKAEEQPKAAASREAGEEKATGKKMDKKAQKSSDRKRSKSLKDENGNAEASRGKSLKEARRVRQGSGAVKEAACDKATKGQSEEREHPSSPSDEELVNSEAQTYDKNKQNRLPVVSEETSSEDSQILGKRKRRQPGEWWLSCSQSTEETKVTDSRPTPKKSKQNDKEADAAAPPPAKTRKDRVLKRRTQTRPAPSTSQSTNKEKKTKRHKSRNARGDVPDEIKASEEVSDVFEGGRTEEQEQQKEDQDLDSVQSSPLDLTNRDHSHNSAPVSPRGSQEQLVAAVPEKRRRNPPSNWWVADGMSQGVDTISSQPQKQEPKPRKERKKRSKQNKSPGRGTPVSKPLGGAPVPPPLTPPKTVKSSLATFKDIFTSATEIPAVVSSREAGRNNRCKVTARPAVDVSVTDQTTHGKADDISADAAEAPIHEPEDMSKALQSGPSSMIELQQDEDSDDLNLPSSTVHAVLSASDLCAPPLKPLILHLKDKANLTEWFKSLWSTTGDNTPGITPDQFDWYFHQGRALGFQVDLNCGSICNGKILLGSYMKKPLWVDHSATTVFNLLTSSVSVTIDGCVSRHHPGQSFMVPCGHAYSIQNVTAQPAVLYFTRIFAESSD